MEHSIFHKVDIKVEDDPLYSWEDGERDPGAPGEVRENRHSTPGSDEEEADFVQSYHQEMFPGLSDDDPSGSAIEDNMCVKLDPCTVTPDPLAVGENLELELGIWESKGKTVNKQQSALEAAKKAYPDIYGVKKNEKDTSKGNGSTEMSKASQDAGQDLVSKYCSQILHYCKLCKFRFPSVQINVQHWSIVHKETPRFCCRFHKCEFSSNSDDMRLHIIQHLVDTGKIVICDHCCVAQLPKHLLYHRRQCLVKGAVAEAEAEVSKGGGDEDVVSQMIEQIIMQGLPFKGHYKKHPPVNVYFNNCFNKCTKCETKLDSSEGLISHWQNEHRGDTFQVACRFSSCKFQTDSHDSLKDHVMQHLVRVGKMSKCPSCAKLLGHGYIKAHLKQCTAEGIKGNSGRPSGLTNRHHFCHLCEKKFTTERFLIKHLEEEHSSEQFNTYGCDYCDKSFLTVSKLKIHTRQAHGKANAYPCDICEKTFSSRGALNSHKSIHENRAHNCEHCDKIFKNPQNLASHVRTVHPKDFNYKCEKCDFKTNRTDQIKIHMMQKHDPNLKPFQCDLCEKKFATKVLFERHKETHLPNEEKYQFTCHYCSSMFTTKSNLNLHIKSHCHGQ